MTKLRPLPLLEIVESYLDYNPETGIGVWKRKRMGPGRQVKVGLPAGTINNQGYIYIGLFGQRYAAHRLFWLLYYKQDPGSKFIDHMDLNKSNNKIANLRLVTKSENGLNTLLPSNNKTGVVGVHYCNTTQKFVAQIKVNNQPRHLGRFENIEDAIIARQKAFIRYA
jgi:hypothetical protein